MAAFHEVRFPANIEAGATGGPGFHTTVMQLGSGYEKRNQDWSKARMSWTVGQWLDDETAIATLTAFFYARAGRAYGFRFRDPVDYSIPGWQNIGVGDGANKTFQIFKTYNSGGYSYQRLLKKLVDGTVRIRVDGLELVLGAGAGKFTVDVNTGIVTLGTAAASLKNVDVMCEFDVPVRFDTDKLDISLEHLKVGSWKGVPIVELRV